MTSSSSSDYDPTFVQCTGFGQNDSNPEPSTFIESIAINKDCSIYENCFVGGDCTIEGILRVGGGILTSGNIGGGSSLNISGNGNFGGVVRAANIRLGEFAPRDSNQVTGFTNDVSPFFHLEKTQDDSVNTPISFFPCQLKNLPDDAIVLAYIPSLNPIPN